MNEQLAFGGACDVTGGSVALRAGAGTWLLQVLVMSHVPE